MQSESVTPVESEATPDSTSESQAAPYPDSVSVPEPELKNASASKPAFFSKQTIITILMIVFMCAILTGIAGMGYWIYQLTTDLNATQDALTALQGKYDNLTVEKDKLAADLDQTRTELEKTREELSTAQSNLTKSKGETAALQKKMGKARALVEVLIATLVERQNDQGIEKTVMATGDGKLKELWTTAKAEPNKTNIQAWLDYLLETTAVLLK
jgi:septal ring factor EnvC (AmiA/AmiB activator)